MMNRIGAGIVCALACSAGAMLVSGPARAAGFYIPEVGTPVSLGTGAVANPTNIYSADAAWTNPAGMTALRSNSWVAGFQAITPEMKFDSSVATGGGDDGGNAGNVAAIPSFFYARKLNDAAHFGLAVTAPMGGGVNYGEGFVGRYQANRAELAAVAVSPSLAYRVNEHLSVGAGVSIIETLFSESIAINQAAVTGVPGTPDGTVRFDNGDDLGYQPYLGLMAQLTERVRLGVVYRAEMDVELGADLNFRNLVFATPAVNGIDIGWDNPQWLEGGLHIKLDGGNSLFMNVGWQDWSAFSDNQLAFDTATTLAHTLERHWKDTWHAGLAYTRLTGEKRGYSAAFAWDASPVTDRYRTFDLPVDEVYKVSGSYFWQGEGKCAYSLGATLYLMGDGEIDQTSQGVRVAGEFDTNHVLFVGGTVRREF